jgi:hypothetical protein
MKEMLREIITFTMPPPRAAAIERANMIGGTAIIASMHLIMMVLVRPLR